MQGPHGTLRTLDEHPNIDAACRAPTVAPGRHVRHVLPMPEDAASGSLHPAGSPAPATSQGTIPRGPLTAELERPAWTRPPVPSTSLRSLRTIDDLQSLLKSPAGHESSNGNGNGSHAPSFGASSSAHAAVITSPVQLVPASSASTAGPDVLTGPGRGAGIGAPAKPQSSSNVVPGPSTRSLVSRSQQTTATAASGNDAAPDGLLTPQPAAEEPESNTGVPVFCMMPLDTVRRRCTL